MMWRARVNQNLVQGLLQEITLAASPSQSRFSRSAAEHFPTLRVRRSPETGCNAYAEGIGWVPIQSIANEIGFGMCLDLPV